MEMNPLSWVLGLGTLWIITRYYWLRLIFSAALLVATGVFALAVPLYLAGVSLAGGRWIIASVQLFFGVCLTAMWLVPAAAAWRWLRWQRTHSTVWQRWDST